MHQILQQTAIVAGMTVVILAGPFLAYCILIFRKRRARSQRRSPLGIVLLRSPGHSLREQLEEAQFDLTSDLFLLMLLPVVGVALYLAQTQINRHAGAGYTGYIYAGLGMCFIAAMVIKLWKAGAKLDRLKAGYDAEVAVGQGLDQLMRRGAHVFHDLPASGFNIDHVVISTEGVFAVETKGYTKPRRGLGRADATVSYDGELLRFPTWTSRKPLEQAERQAEWLAKWLTSAVAGTVHVHPVLALPGWFVELKGRGAVSVYNGKQLAQLLDSRCAHRLSEQDVQRVAHQVEQRCRTVAPKYSATENPK